MRQKTDDMTNDIQTPTVAARVLPGLGILIAFLLALAGPALIVLSIVLAFAVHEADLIAPGILGGAMMGTCGTLALLWCLAKAAPAK